MSNTLIHPADAGTDPRPGAGGARLASALAPLLGLVGGAIAAGTVLPGWAWMWVIALALFVGCKWLTFRLAQGRLAHVRPGRAAGYLLGWVGMNARTFLDPAHRAARPSPSQWLLAAAKTATGLAVLWGVTPTLPEDAPILRAWVGMIGLILALHFGLFHLLSLAWRQARAEAPPLMQAPLRAASLSDFWGRRWNAAFRQLTFDLIFRPLARRFGPVAATLAAFTLSGLVHDLVISVPARAGFGLPTLYFLIQGLGLLAERSRLGRSLGLGGGLIGWLFTALILAAPLPLLFHRPFVLHVVLPFLEVLGAA